MSSSESSAAEASSASPTPVRPAVLPLLRKENRKAWFILVRNLATEAGIWASLDPDLGIEPVKIEDVHKAQILLLPALCEDDLDLTDSCADPRASLLVLKAKYDRLAANEAVIALAQLRAPVLLPGDATETFAHMERLRARVVSALPNERHYWTDHVLLSSLLDLLPMEWFGHIRSLVDGPEPDTFGVLRAIALAEGRQALAQSTAGAATTQLPRGRGPTNTGRTDSRADSRTDSRTCAYCKKNGHTIDRCRAKQAADKKRVAASAIHVAATGTPSLNTGSLTLVLPST